MKKITFEQNFLQCLLRVRAPVGVCEQERKKKVLLITGIFFIEESKQTKCECVLYFTEKKSEGKSVLNLIEGAA